MKIRSLAANMVTARGATSQATAGTYTGQSTKRIAEYETDYDIDSKKHPLLSDLKRLAYKLGKNLNCRDFVKG